MYKRICFVCEGIDIILSIIYASIKACFYLVKMGTPILVEAILAAITVIILIIWGIAVVLYEGSRARITRHFSQPVNIN